MPKVRMQSSGALKFDKPSVVVHTYAAHLRTYLRQDAVKRHDTTSWLTTRIKGKAEACSRCTLKIAQLQTCKDACRRRACLSLYVFALLLLLVVFRTCHNEALALGLTVTEAA